MQDQSEITGPQPHGEVDVGAKSRDLNNCAGLLQESEENRMNGLLEGTLYIFKRLDLIKKKKKRNRLGV